MKGNAYTVAYLAILGAACALLLTGARVALEPRQEANRRAAEVRTILTVLEAPVPDDPDEALRLYERTVRTDKQAGLTFYLYAPEGDVRTAAVPFAGSGVWGPVKGYLAFTPDLKRLKGVSFYEQQETPGLGGEIESPEWRGQFVGRRVRGPGGEPGIELVSPGRDRAEHQAYAITGATMTSRKVESILNETIRKVVREARPYAE